jgi:hypothetical protein
MVTYINVNLDNFGMDDKSRFGDWYQRVYLALYDLYKLTYRDWYDETKRTPFVTQKLANYEKELIPITRTLYAMLKGNVLVTDEDLVAMHLPVRSDHKPHPSPVATHPPKVTIIPLEDSWIKITYTPEEPDGKRGKPKGQHGVEIKWGFSEEEVKDADKLPNSLFDTASPYILKFSPEDAGRTVNIALRWENTRGEKGPWSRIVRVTVP